MLSRVAEKLYWFGRYVERAEDMARVVNVNANLLLDLPQDIALGWEPLVAITGSAEQYAAHYESTDERSVVRFLVGDARNPSSILSSLAMARENCRTIRDIVPREAWEQINELHHFARDNLASGLSKRGRHAYLSAIIRGGQTLSGLLLGTMSHDAGHEFLRAGRILERGDMTSRIVDVRSETLLPEETTGLRPFENIQWIGVLKSLTAYQMYRQHMQVRVRREDALRFLVCDGMFPRALYRCVSEVHAGLERLPRSDAPRRIAARLMRATQSADIATIAWSNSELHEFIDQFQLGIGQLHESIAETYFRPGSSGTAP